MISLRKLQLLAGLLGCYTLAGFTWWHTLGCGPIGSNGSLAGALMVSASPATAGSVTVQCAVPEQFGAACPLPGSVRNDSRPLIVCLTPSGPDFSHWSEDCGCGSGDASYIPCDAPNECRTQVFNSTTRTCVASFCDAFELSVEVIGTGEVESDPAGIDCPGKSCRSTFCDVALPGIVPTIELVATERVGSGQAFAGWGGDPDCDDGVVDMDADKSCVAVFGAPVLSVSTTGAGSVTGLPGLACRENSPPAECESSAPLASYVTLYADPDPAAQLIAWGGDCPDGQASSQLVMTGDLSCTATFSAAGAGGGGVIEILSLADDESLGDHPVDVDESQLSGSADLSVVAFRSGTTYDPSEPEPDWRAYARDREAGTTQPISGPAPPLIVPSGFSLSADGLFAAYAHSVPDPSFGYVYNVYRRDLSSGVEELISIDYSSSPTEPYPAISGNGRFVAYVVQEGFAAPAVVVSDTCSGAPPAEACAPHTVVISEDPDGGLAGPDGPPRISRDGRFVLFRGYTETGSGPTLFLRDRDIDVDGVFDEPGFATTIVAAPDPSGGLLELHFFVPLYDLDASGRYVAVQSPDADLPDTGGTVSFGRSFLRDTCAGAPAGCVPTYTMLTLRQDGTPVDDSQQTLFSDLSGSGRYAMFYTTDALLVGSDPSAFQNAAQSVLRDTCVGAPPGCTPGNVLVSRLANGSPLPVSIRIPRVADDGGAAVFFGPRVAVVASPNPYYDEVLFAPTGIVPDPGGTPAISGRSPASVLAGSPELILTLTGSNFAPAAGVLWNGVARPAIFISLQKLQIRLSEADLATAGISTVRVVNPGGLTSGQVAFRVN